MREEEEEEEETGEGCIYMTDKVMRDNDETQTFQVPDGMTIGSRLGRAETLLHSGVTAFILVQKAWRSLPHVCKRLYQLVAILDCSACLNGRGVPDIDV